VGCQVDWIVPTPIQCCGPANGVQVNASDAWEWITGDMGDQYYTTLAYGTEYRSLGWTITPTSDGTTFTHDSTGHGMTVSVNGVDPF
jgi:serine/threonine-protein kinase